MNASTRLIVTALLVAVMLVVTNPPLMASPHRERDPLVRKNVLELTQGERRSFVHAVFALKDVPSPYDPTLSYYDQFVEWHRTLYRCSGTEHDIRVGHGGPFFLPWHRAFVRLFEQALRDVSDENIAVPYWDWSDQASTDAVFQDDFMGQDGDPDHGYAVMTGPFRKGAWTLNIEPEGLMWTSSFQPYLVRRWGSGGPITRPPVTDVAWALRAPDYDAPPYDMSSDPNRSFRNALEGWWRVDPAGLVRYSDAVDHQHCGPDGRLLVSREAGKLHNQVHSWTGGVVGDPTGPTVFGTMMLPTSPSDPVFFLHHSNIDRLWAKWQNLHCADFEPASQAGSLIEPFASAGVHVTPESLASINNLGYTYSPHVDSDDVLVPPSEPCHEGRQSSPASAPATTGRHRDTSTWACLLSAQVI